MFARIGIMKAYAAETWLRNTIRKASRSNTRLWNNQELPTARRAV